MARPMASADSGVLSFASSLASDKISFRNNQITLNFPIKRSPDLVGKIMAFGANARERNQ
jgi:hypothetical protein